jgi:hypothetical protein
MTQEDRVFLSGYSDYVIRYIEIMRAEAPRCCHSLLQFKMLPDGTRVDVRTNKGWNEEEITYKARLMRFNPSRKLRVKQGGASHRQIATDIKIIREEAKKYYTDNNIEFDETVFEYTDPIKPVKVIRESGGTKYYLPDDIWIIIKEYMGVDIGINIRIPMIIRNLAKSKLDNILNLLMPIHNIREFGETHNKEHNIKMFYKNMCLFNGINRKAITDEIVQKFGKWEPPANIRLGDEIFIERSTPSTILKDLLPLCGKVFKINKSSIVVQLYAMDIYIDGNIPDYAPYKRRIEWDKERMSGIIEHKTKHYILQKEHPNDIRFNNIICNTWDRYPRFRAMDDHPYRWDRIENF